jgi:hypothetical protein
MTGWCRAAQDDRVGEIRRVAREDRVQEDPHLHLQLREVQVQVSLRSG